MYMIAEVSQYVAVASFPEAWIEIQIKYTTLFVQPRVASFPEAWIEIEPLQGTMRYKVVASFPEAWIEI